jgi:succinyl-CoA synthetase alpha subunit
VTLFFDRTHRVLVQGITGREGRMVVSHMLAYGTEVHAGVTPGRAGETVERVPVFDTVAQAVAEAGGPFDVSIVYVPPLAALEAVADAVNAAVPFLIVVGGLTVETGFSSDSPASESATRSASEAMR